MVFITPPPTRAESSNAFARSGSILAVDFGNVQTRAVLIDLVDGIYQLVASGEARTTAGFPEHDVGIGLSRAAQAISRATGRRLLTDDETEVITPEQADRSGVDIVRFTASIGRPLRTVLMGLVPDQSIISAARATAGTYVQIVETISLDDNRTPQQQMNAVLLARPDLIFIVGGTEDGARAAVMEFVNLARLALRFSDRANNPPVLFAGNVALAGEVRDAFADITTVFLAENVRPSLEREALESAGLELTLAYDAVSSTRGLGFDRIGRMSDLGVLPTASSYDIITEYLGRVAAGGRRAAGVLIADIGSAVSTLSASVSGSTITSIRTDIGLGSSAVETLNAAGIAAVRAWLPFLASDDEITAYALNKTLHPAHVPDTRRSMYLEHGLLRAALRGLLSASRPLWTGGTALDDPNAPMPPFAQMIGAGAAITRTGSPGMSAMLMLDALQPTGVTLLQTDSGALIPALGALARTNPEAVVQVLEAVGVQDLGTVISLSGLPRLGRVAARVSVTIHKSDGSTDTTRHVVNGGDLWVYRDLPSGVRATISVRARGMTIGGKRNLKAEIIGGTAGVIIDARGRPLPVPSEIRARAETLARWYANATGDEAHEIPEEWLSEAKRDADDARRPARRARRSRGEVAATNEALTEVTTVEESKRVRRRRGKNNDEAPPPTQAELDKQKKEDDFDDLRNLFS